MTAKPWYANAALSMAHLCELDTPPVELIGIAAKAGIASVGLRIAPAAPGGIVYPLHTATEQAEVRRRSRDTGVEVLYIELISLTERTNPGDYRRMLETGAAVGATRVAVAGNSGSLEVIAEKMAGICDIAKPMGIAVDIEFMPFRGVRTLAEALVVVDACCRPNAYILIDALHITRSNTPIDAIRALDPKLVGTFQICDGPLAAPQDLVAEARTNRQIPGEGQMALLAMLDTLPAGTAIGVEVPMAPRLPGENSPTVRLAHLAAATRAYLDKGHPT